MKNAAKRPLTLHATIFIAILLLALFLRFYCLTCSSLWHDEGNSWALAQRSFAQIAQDAAADIHPPGYYWLLKLWTALFGISAWGVRSFSGLAGMLTVVLVYRIGLAERSMYRPTCGDTCRERAGSCRLLFALLAAFLAALNPFQIFYSQEARMYALLMLESAVLFWALPAPITSNTAETGHRPRATDHWKAFLYWAAAVAGLWTHYIFPVVLVAAGGTSICWWWQVRADTRHWMIDDGQPERMQRHPVPGLPYLLFFLILNALAFLFYLPWLPTAIERLLNWPGQNGFVRPTEGLHLLLQTLAVGPIRSGPQLAWGWLVLAGALPLLGGWRLRRSTTGPALLLWLLLPLGMMFVFGLFNQSFLKFLLIASPAWCLLSAAAVSKPLMQRRTAFFGTIPYASGISRHGLRAALAILVAALALVTLPTYYADPAARDNYAGMAHTVAALGDADTDLVLLNAPGQADVWRLYDVGLDTLPLPTQRPANRAVIEATLAQATAERRQIFALLWATDQSDPNGFVESWLGRHAFKGLESWQGNVRFALYNLPHGLSCTMLARPPRFGDIATLTEICLSDEPLSAGATLLVGLRWKPLTRPERRFKVTVQLLDPRDQIIAQQDGEPGGGRQPTTDWQPHEIVSDNHGLLLPPGTPPGEYRLIVALYDAENGARLSTPSGDALQLSQLTLVRPTRPLPITIIPMQHRANRQMGPLTLVGYDFYRQGFTHAPATTVTPGDVVHIVLYWQAPAPLPNDWPTDLTLRLRLGEQVVNAPLAGGKYPTGQWHAAEFVRGSFDIRFDGATPILTLEVRDSQMRLGKIPYEKVR